MDTYRQLTNLQKVKGFIAPYLLILALCILYARVMFSETDFWQVILLGAGILVLVNVGLSASLVVLAALGTVLGLRPLSSLDKELKERPMLEIASIAALFAISTFLWIAALGIGGIVLQP